MLYDNPDLLVGASFAESRAVPLGARLGGRTGGVGADPTTMRASHRSFGRWHPLFGELVDGQMLLDDPVVAQGRRALHLRDAVHGCQSAGGNPTGDAYGSSRSRRA